jgi:hypothetical protein
MRNVFFHFGMTVGSVITLPLQQLLGPGLFDVVLKGAKDYAIALSVMLGGILILGLLIKVTDRDDIMKRSIVCSILVMWIVGFSQIAVKAII